tara:strand:+ start:271 stop:450 length:180 start_codon:yes stop_codon:yes gene_type:complete
LLLIPEDRVKLHETLVNKRRGLVKFREAVFLVGLKRQVLYVVMDVDILEFWKKIRFSEV